MKRKVFKWMLGISIALLLFIVVYLVVFWAVANATAAMASALMSYEEHAPSYKYINLLEFYSNFIGSPMFYISLVPIITLITSIVMLIVTKDKKKS